MIFVTIRLLGGCMKNPVLLDMKRLSRGKAGIAIALLSPVIILACFAAVVAPVFFDTGEGYVAALYCEDNDTITRTVVQSLVDTEKSRAVMQLAEVSSLEEGQARIRAGAACLIHIPGGFRQALETGGQSTLYLYRNEAKPLEGAIVYDVLSSGAALLNEAQTGVNVLYAAVQKNAGEDAASQAFTETSRIFLVNALDKSAVFVTDTISPLGALQPVEYYAAALLLVFLSLSALSLYALMASDVSGGIVSRHFSMGRGAFSAIAPRVASGGIFIFLQGLPALLLYLPVCLASFAYGGSVLLMPLSLITLALFISSLACFLGVLIRYNIKAVFLLLTLLLFIGGAIIPVSFFGALAQFAAVTPFASALRMVFDSFFFFEKGGFVLPWLYTSLYTLAFFFAAAALVKRRA
jgi:hypothetical protein